MDKTYFLDGKWLIRESKMEHYQDELLDFSEFEFDDEVDDAFEM